MNAREVPVTFDCAGDELVGMVHVPEQVRARGLLFIVAGGPQYRGGVGRQQVSMARQLAAQGVPVMRFDFRGVGDSAGEFRDFEDVEDDLRAAVAVFRREVPDMPGIVLWGGCNAASAIMINSWKFPEVTGMALSNPWVHDPDGQAIAVVRQHYSKRIRERDFWMKLLKLQYNPLPAVGVVLRGLGQKLAGSVSSGADTPAKATSDLPDDPTMAFRPRMRLGMERFGGDVLLLMSGKSVVGQEFDDLLGSNPKWQAAMQVPGGMTRHDMPDADQMQSSMASQRELVRVASAWLLGQPLTASTEQSETRQSEPVAS
jgi:exosortase A-associated hydrolase 1